MVRDRITLSKRGLMIAGLGFLVATFGVYVPLKSPLVAAAAEVTYQNYTVVAGDSLYFIGIRFGVTVQALMTANNLTAADLQIGQVLRVPSTSAKPTYTVQANDTLYLIAKRFGTTLQQLKTINSLNSDLLLVGQVLKLPGTAASSPASPDDNNTAYAQYKVCAGDSLYLIGKKYGVSVNQLMSVNNLQSTEIRVNQILLVPAAAAPTSPTSPTVPTSPASPDPDSASWTIPQGTALVHVKSGQTIWGLANEYRTTAAAIMTTNHLHVDWLGVDQPLFIPVNSTQAISVTAPKIAAKPGFGEFLDWEYVYWIFDIGNRAVIQDLTTGKRFTVKRMGGSNHADCEPLTSADSQTMLQIFGGSWGWKYRSVLVEVDGRVLAGSMAGMPHDIDTIADNNFSGHFDMHFLNSRQHNTNEITPEHQANVRTAAGY